MDGVQGPLCSGICLFCTEYPYWCSLRALGTVLGTRDTPSKQSRGGPALLGLTAWYPPLQLPDEGGPAAGHSRGRPRDTGWGWDRCLSFHCPQVCSEWEQMPGWCHSAALWGRLLADPWSPASMESVSGHFGPVGVTAPWCCSGDTGVSLLCWTEQDWKRLKVGETPEGLKELKTREISRNSMLGFSLNRQVMSYHTLWLWICKALGSIAKICGFYCVGNWRCKGSIQKNTRKPGKKGKEWPISVLIRKLIFIWKTERFLLEKLTVTKGPRLVICSLSFVLPGKMIQFLFLFLIPRIPSLLPLPWLSSANAGVQKTIMLLRKSISCL